MYLEAFLYLPETEVLLRYHTPDWLYESLPYLYLTSGALAIYATHNALGAFCGSLLIMAALAVWQMRRVYRKHAGTRRRTRSTNTEAAVLRHALAGTSSPGAPKELARVAWSQTFETGDAVIDKQHRVLFSRTNELISAVLADEPEPDIALMLDELVVEIARHFRTEDALLDRTSHPAASEHKALHADLLRRVRDLHALQQSGLVSTAELSRFLADEIISGHIAHSDLELVASG